MWGKNMVFLIQEVKEVFNIQYSHFGGIYLMFFLSKCNSLVL